MAREIKAKGTESSHARFVTLRKQKRRSKPDEGMANPPAKSEKLNKRHSKSRERFEARVAFNVQVSAKLDKCAKAFHINRVVMVRRIAEWFADQPSLVQSLVLGRHSAMARQRIDLAAQLLAHLSDAGPRKSRHAN